MCNCVEYEKEVNKSQEVAHFVNGILVDYHDKDEMSQIIRDAKQMNIIR